MFEVVNFVAIVGAAIVKIGLGMFWYSDAGFGKQWKKLSKVKPNKDKVPVAFVGMTINSVITAFVLAGFALHLGATDLASGAALGFKCWMGFVMPFSMSAYFWENKPLNLVYINSGYELAALVAMGVVMAVY